MSAMPPHWPSSSEDDVATQASQWQPAALQPAFAQPLKHKATKHIPVLRVAARLTKMGAGHYLIDMAKEIQGGITVTFRRGRLGTTVNVGYGEESHDSEIDPPTPHGSTLPGCLNCTVRCCPMRTTNVFHSVWTLRDGEQTCGEHEYKQFRYAELVLSDPSVELLPQDVEGWVVRYPLSSEDLAIPALSLAGGDRRAAPYRKLHPTRGLATWSSSSASLDRVQRLCVYTLLSASLDTSTDSNTRQRSTCHIDMLVANLGLLNLVAERAMVTHNTALMLQADSDILDGWADFKAATVFSMHHAIMYTHHSTSVSSSLPLISQSSPKETGSSVQVRGSWGRRAAAARAAVLLSAAALLPDQLLGPPARPARQAPTECAGAARLRSDAVRWGLSRLAAGESVRFSALPLVPS
jgi:hypothetical protein